jgi:hypothetical protein
LGDKSEVVFSHWAPLARLTKSVGDLLSLEGLYDATSFSDRQLSVLEGGEAAIALGALAAPTDRLAVVGHSTVNDSGVLVAAKGAMHWALPLSSGHEASGPEPNNGRLA